MEKQNIAKKYAEILYSEVNDKEKCMKFLKVLTEIVTNHEEFRLMLVHPYINKEEKLNIAKDVMGEEIRGVQENFLKLILDYSRIEYIEDIYREFKKIYNESSKIQSVKIFTADKIKKELVEEIKMVLSKKLDKKIIEEIIVDKELIGGIKILIGDEIYDGSIRNKLDKFKRKILQEAM